MLGVYNNFPKAVHNIADFAFSISNKRLQSALVETFYKLNNETLTLEEVATPSIPQCTVTFEFGVAEDTDFNYLDKEEKDKLLKSIRKKPFALIDFLSIVRYRKVKAEKKTPLKSDCYMFRFQFDREAAQMQIFHEKGLMYVSPKDLPEFTIKRINSEFSKKVLKLAEQN
jgi:hypothetical protein